MRSLTDKLLIGHMLLAAGCGAAGGGSGAGAAEPTEEEAGPSAIDDDALERIERALVAKHGQGSAHRARLGLSQVAKLWRPTDGDASALEAFAVEHFVADEAALALVAGRLERSMEMIDGHTHEIERELHSYQDVAEGEMHPVDGLLASYSPSAHITEDLFRSRVAFAALLNFPLTTLDERVTSGAGWSRDQWAAARLTGRFEYRVPPEAIQEVDRAVSEASRYIDGYNIHMGRLAKGGVSAGFPADMTLISHWGLRDEIKALYGQPEGALDKQRVIYKVMDRIIRQQIPAAVVGSDALEWDPETNLVREPGEGTWREADREEDLRYERLLGVFRANRGIDPHVPTLPSHIDRSFARDREMPEGRVRALLESVLTSEAAAQAGQLVAARLGRPLEPFDLWYTGFRPGSGGDEEALSAITRERYPDAQAFHRDLPRILGELGFDEQTATFLAEHIVVEPARGPGEAMGAHRREDSARLRTRIGDEGMDYKGFNIAVHELGHTVEQVFSMSRIDHTLLEGVPNTGFTEAFAFLFQARDLELLGQSPPGGERAEALRAVNRFWNTFEIAAVGLLDIEIWHWMYDHPEATAAETRDAMVQIAQDIWNRYFAPIFGVRDTPLLAIYSHIIAYGLYTPDYSLGMLITSQVEAHVRTRSLAAEMERMCLLGRLAPDVWMQQAVGGPVSAAPLLEAAEQGLETLQSTPEG